MTEKRKERSEDRLGRKYLTILSGFIAAFLVILILPYFLGRNFNFPDVELDRFQPIGGNLHVAMVRREFNPEQELMRLDIMIEDAMTSTRLSNLEFEAEVRYITGTRELSVDMRQISDHFIVIYIENLPQNFGVLSLNLTPYLIHPELHGGSNLASAGIRMYVNETPELFNYDLSKGDSIDHRHDLLNVEERFLWTAIEDKEEGIRQHNFSISFLRDAIYRLQDEMFYMTLRERDEAYQMIMGHENAIANHERNITDLQAEIVELEERILWLEERRLSI